MPPRNGSEAADDDEEDEDEEQREDGEDDADVGVRLLDQQQCGLEGGLAEERRDRVLAEHHGDRQQHGRQDAPPQVRQDDPPDHAAQLAPSERAASLSVTTSTAARLAAIGRNAYGSTMTPIAKASVYGVAAEDLRDHLVDRDESDDQHDRGDRDRDEADELEHPAELRETAARSESSPAAAAPA